MLTGKCREDFEKWLDKQKDTSNELYVLSQLFNIIPISAQFGVYVDFFESKEIYVETYYAAKETYEIIINENGYSLCKTRQEAIKQAILKANSIYNESK